MSDTQHLFGTGTLNPRCSMLGAGRVLRESVVTRNFLTVFGTMSVRLFIMATVFLRTTSPASI